MRHSPIFLYHRARPSGQLPIFATENHLCSGPMAAAIEIEDLEVIRGGRTIIEELSLEVEAGSVTGLLGPSGSGKTTLMRAIVGVQIVKSGRVTVLGLPAGSPPL